MTGKVQDLSCANHIYQEIINNPQICEWTSETKDRYKKILQSYSFPDESSFSGIHCRKKTRFDSVQASLLRRIELEKKIKGDNNNLQVNSISINDPTEQIDSNKQTNFPSIVGWIRKSQNLIDLEKNFELHYSYHSEHPNLLILFHSRLLHSINQSELDCGNGLIIDKDDDWRIISYSIPSFGHYNQKYRNKNFSFFFIHFSFWLVSSVSEFNWEKVVSVTEHLDGVPCTLYFYKNKWHLSSFCEADKPSVILSERNLNRISLEKLFWEIWDKNQYRMPENQNCCYHFELISRTHRNIVKPSPFDKLCLVLVRDMDSLKELEVESIALKHGWHHVTRLCENQQVSLEMMVNLSMALNPFHQRGFVLKDNEDRRIKIDCPEYISMQASLMPDTLLKFNWSGEVDERMMLEMIRTSSDHVFIEYFPECLPYRSEMRNKYFSIMENIDKVYKQIHLLHLSNNKKEYAKQASGYWFSFLLFAFVKDNIICNHSAQFYSFSPFHQLKKTWDVVYKKKEN